MFIGAGKVKLQIPYSNSLKDKRGVVNSIKGRVSKKFNVSIAEVGSLDNRSEAEIGFSMVSYNKDYIHGAFEKVLNFINDNFDILVITEEFDIMKY